MPKLLSQANFSNITVTSLTTTSAATFTMTHVRSSTTTEIIKDASVPPSDAYVPLDGKLVLETSDSIKIQASANSSLKLILSILETANA